MDHHYALMRTFVFLSLIGIGVCQKNHNKNAYALSSYLRYEMYAGQFPHSSGLPTSSHGSILRTGWGFEGMWQHSLAKTISFQFGFGLERYKRFYARQGESLKGVGPLIPTWGFTSPPVPYDTYYHVQNLSLRAGFRISTQSKHPSSMMAGFQLASFQAYFGNSKGTKIYSESFLDIFPGYYIRFQQDVVFYTQEQPILGLGIFLGLNSLFTARQDKVIRNFLWQGVDITINEAMHGASAYVIGLALTI